MLSYFQIIAFIFGFNITRGSVSRPPSYNLLMPAICHFCVILGVFLIPGAVLVFNILNMITSKGLDCVVVWCCCVQLGIIVWYSLTFKQGVNELADKASAM